LRRQIWDLVCEAQLAADLKELRRERHGDHEHVWDDRLSAAGAPRALEGLSARGFAHLLEDLDTYLCDLGRAQIRGGLHVLGDPPTGTALIDLLFAILRSPNGPVASLTEAVTRACGIAPGALGECRGIWREPVPAILPVAAPATAGQIRTAIDELARHLLRELAVHDFAVEPIDRLVSPIIDGAGVGAAEGAASVASTLRFACEVLVPKIAATTDETRYLLHGLAGRYVPAGPAGAPTRGMAHVLPTGRNFYTFDPRGLPTRAAWTTGEELARKVLARHLAEAGAWPESIAMSLWGTPTLRSGGDEIAQALALIGVRPRWDPETHRTIGLDVVPLPELGRPRIDVTLRISGFFRDALSVLVHWFDEAVQRVAMLDEPPEQNFLRKHWLAEGAELVGEGVDTEVARRRAAYRVFGPRPGAYGTALLALIEGKTWTDSRDLAGAAVSSSEWAYSRGVQVEAAAELARRLALVDLVVQCQDTREQDLLDSSDYFESHGGLVVAATRLSGRRPRVYFADSSEPTHVQVRTLQMETLRVYRSRVVYPKWLSAMQRHGYRGGLEMAATVDCLFGYAATAAVVPDWMFEGVARSFTGAEARQFLLQFNPWALSSIAERLLEAEQRDMWRPLAQTASALRSVLLDSEAALEDGTGAMREYS
jgi:cobaltochelatase CobN